MSPTASKYGVIVPPTLRSARFDDYPQIQALEASHNLLTLSPRDWRAIWQEHPLRNLIEERQIPIGWVLEDHNARIVGSMANVPTKYVIGGRELIAATGRAWVVEPEYRGVALWLMDEYFNQTTADLFINTTVNSLAVDPFSVFGSTRVPLGNWKQAAFRVTNYRGFARAALKIKKLPMPGIGAWPAGALLWMRDAIRGTASATANGTVSFATQFDDRFDSFWEELRAKYPNKLLGARDRATLAWHFASSLRANELWVYVLERKGSVRAYAVCKRQDHPPSGLTRVRLVDYQSIDSEEENDADQLALISAIAGRCAAERISVFEHVCCDLPKMRAFDAFAPYRRDLPAWPFYFKANDPELQTALGDPAVWDPSTFDGDASL